MGYIYITLTILLTAYGQLVLKWRMNLLGELPEALLDKLIFLVKAIFDPYIFSSFFAAFIASLTWMAALSKFDLSFAYPFMSMAFVVVLIASYYMLNEPLNLYKVVGMLFIVVGLVIASR
jgi:multidrug transporter EmrE-like cation transporter